jgi:dTDP-4-amino-4,6-dideoxygalactose transaminase
MKEIIALCREHNLVLVEDACQAHGAQYAGQKVGSFGIGCFSFYPTKNMTTSEGGIITTNREDVARKARMTRQHGQSERYVHDILGYNFRMTDIEAVIGISQLRNLDMANDKRTRNAMYLTEHISKIKGLIPPYVAPNRRHVYHQFTIKVTEGYGLSRDELRRRLTSEGIGTGVHYPIPIHKQPLYRSMGYNDNLSVTEAVSKQVLSLPVHPGLTDEELKTITRALER